MGRVQVLLGRRLAVASRFSPKSATSAFDIEKDAWSADPKNRFSPKAVGASSTLKHQTVHVRSD